MNKTNFNVDNKLLNRQIQKYLSDDLLQHEDIQRFIVAINQSYNAYERDRQLSDHAFKLTERDYLEINQTLRATEMQLEIKNKELAKSYEALKDVNSQLEELVEQRTSELEQSESRFRSMIETATDIIYRTDFRGFFMYANPVAIKKMGYSMDELTTMHFTQLIKPDTRDELVEFYQYQWKNQLKESYKEFPAIAKTGEIIWLGQNVIFSYDPEGKVTQISAVARDITASKMSQTRLRNLMTNMQSGMLLVDSSGKVILINKQFCDLFNIRENPESMTSQNAIELIRKLNNLFTADCDFIRRTNKVLHEKKLVLNDQFRLKDGRVFERDYIPIYIDKLYSGHIWNYYDITEKVEAAKAIERNEQKYRSIIANMNLGLVETDMNNHIQFVNHSFCEMSGYSEDELIDRKLTKFYQATESNKRKTIVKASFDAYELKVFDKNKEPRWWLISAAPMINETGKQTGSIGIHLDITKQKILENELIDARMIAENSAKAKEAFLANMSHEIRTPMNGVIGMARQLQKTTLDERQQLYLDTINSAAEHLLVILNDILDLSKIEAGKLEIENVPFSIEKMMARCKNILSPKAEEKGIVLEMELSSGISDSHIGDSYRLSQLILNLAGNSVKFTDYGAVKIRCHVVEDNATSQKLVFEVEDTGIGMDQKFIDNIFDNFSQEESSTSRKYGGTGLGMSISKQLIDLMGGNIDIRSEKNKGTLVSFQLVLPKSNKMAIEHPQEIDYSQTSHQFEKKRILLAEDNEINQLVVQAIFEPTDIELVMVDNGLKAVDAVKHDRFDLVLMDMHMPVMDGKEAILQIRNELKMEVPIIALTANAIKGAKSEYLQLGANDYLAKPFNENELFKLLAKWIGESTNNQDSIGSREVITEPIPEISETNKTFNLDKLHELLNGNTAIIEKMVDIFIETIPNSIKEIKDAYATNDMAGIYAIAHRIKPNFGSMGMEDIFKKMELLELMAESNDPGPKMESLIGEIDENVVLCVRDLKKQYSHL